MEAKDVSCAAADAYEPHRSRRKRHDLQGTPALTIQPVLAFLVCVLLLESGEEGSAEAFNLLLVVKQDSVESQDWSHQLAVPLD